MAVQQKKLREAMWNLLSGVFCQSTLFLIKNDFSENTDREAFSRSTDEAQVRPNNTRFSLTRSSTTQPPPLPRRSRLPNKHTVQHGKARRRRSIDRSIDPIARLGQPPRECSRPHRALSLSRSSRGKVVTDRTSDHRTRATGTTPTPLSSSLTSNVSLVASTAWNTPDTSTLRRGVEEDDDEG